MKIARIGLDQGPRYAVVDEEGDGLILLADDLLFGKDKLTSQRLKPEDVRLVFPMIPRSKTVGFGGSYLDDEPPASADDLLVFLKPNTSVVGPNDPIVLPPHLPKVVHEVELAMVIRRVAKGIPPEWAHEATLGYAITNDITGIHANLAVAKGTDMFYPVDPYIETEPDPSDLTLASRIDSEFSCEGRTSQLAFSVPELVSHASKILTLLSEDIVLTGSPGICGVDPRIASGQAIEVERGGIGRLRDPVIRR